MYFMYVQNNVEGAFFIIIFIIFFKANKIYIIILSMYIDNTVDI